MFHEAKQVDGYDLPLCLHQTATGWHSFNQQWGRKIIQPIIWFLALGDLLYIYIYTLTHICHSLIFFLSFICSYPISACCIGRDRNNRLHQKIYNFCSVRKQIVNTSWSNNSYARRSKFLKEIFFYMRRKNFKRKLISNKKKS